MGHYGESEGQRPITSPSPLDRKQYTAPKNLLKILYTNLSNVHQVGIFPSSGSIGSEDGSSISIRIVIYYLDGFIQSVCLQNYKNWTKNFLFVTGHCWLSGVIHPEKKSVLDAYLVLYYPLLTWTAFMLGTSLHCKPPLKKKSVFAVFQIPSFQ